MPFDKDATLQSHNSNKTTQVWFSQQTRGWPWSSWTNKTTTTKHKHFYKTPTPTKFSTRILPPLSSTYLSNYQDLSTQKYKQLLQSHLNLWPTQNSQNRYPPQTYSLQFHLLGIYHVNLQHFMKAKSWKQGKLPHMMFFTFFLSNKGYNRWYHSSCHKISLLEFCLTHTYFLFQGKYYEQVQGAAMGSL